MADEGCHGSPPCAAEILIGSDRARPRARGAAPPPFHRDHARSRAKLFPRCPLCAHCVRRSVAFRSIASVAGSLRFRVKKSLGEETRRSRGGPLRRPAHQAALESGGIATLHPLLGRPEKGTRGLKVRRSAWVIGPAWTCVVCLISLCA